MFLPTEGHLMRSDAPGQGGPALPPVAANEGGAAKTTEFGGPGEGSVRHKGGHSLEHARPRRFSPRPRLEAVGRRGDSCSPLARTCGRACVVMIVADTGGHDWKAEGELTWQP